VISIRRVIQTLAARPATVPSAASHATGPITSRVMRATVAPMANTDFRPATMDRVGGDAVQPDRRQEQRERAEIPGDHRQQTIADVYGRSVSVTV